MDQLINSPAVEWPGCLSVPLLLTSPPKTALDRPAFHVRGCRAEQAPPPRYVGPNKHGEGKVPGLPSLPRSLELLGLAAAHSSSLIITSWLAALPLPPPARLELSSLARQLAPLVFQPAGFSAISFPPCQTASAGFHSLQINRVPKGQIFR